MKVVRNIFSLLITLLLIQAVSFGQKPTKPTKPPLQPVNREKKLDKPKTVLRAPSGKGFYIESLGEDHATFSLLLADDKNQTVAGTFRRAQVEIFEALMEEARKFAESDEAAGAPGSPKTTRFMDKDEKSFIVDVEKVGLESRFYVTLQTLQGTLTVEAGMIKRGSKKNTPLFYAMITRVQAARNSQ
ncbi:MAG: hypothetical protein WBV94_28185 [Blastocatellia bacterium]